MLFLVVRSGVVEAAQVLEFPVVLIFWFWSGSGLLRGGQDEGSAAVAYGQRQLDGEREREWKRNAQAPAPEAQQH
jgi:hypothetical protein